ncbi:AbrB family transcriptional regulator [Yoonia sp.]|uniref:AbrB family transcriptional regulator n=1 Tax=Yoonia sp. TaxID=2212373 RepID=UPI003F6BCF52
MADLPSQALALSIGVASGVAAYLAGLPLPWMLGPMIGNTVAAMLRAPVAGPLRLRPWVMPVIGVLLGSSVTAGIFGRLGSWGITLALLPAFLAIAAALSYQVYRRFGGYDPVTAFYAAMPGGVNEMLILGTEAGGNERRIALAHAARILLVICFVAVFFGLFLGVTSGGGGAVWVGLDALGMADYLILGFCAVAGAWAGKHLRLPASAIFGPMILSGIAHVTGWVTVAPPSLLVIAAQITVGTIIGTRFVGATLRELRRDLGLAAIVTLVMLGVATGFAAALSRISGVPLEQAFLAYSPGGLTEMSLLTLALGQDVAYVSIMHIIRITLVIGSAPFVFGRIIGRRPLP